MDFNQVLMLIGVAIGGLLLVGLYLRRDALRDSVKRLSVAGLIFAFVPHFIWWRDKPFIRFLVGWCVAIVADTLIFPPRSRNIRDGERQEAIRRFEERTGRKYDPAMHDVDHAIAFVRGGGSTSDNLRVMDRSENRSKGAKTPWWDVLGHLQGNSETPLEAWRRVSRPRDTTQSTADRSDAGDT